jgi:hypothetical protein
VLQFVAVLCARANAVQDKEQVEKLRGELDLTVASLAQKTDEVSSIASLSSVLTGVDWALDRAKGWRV